MSICLTQMPCHTSNHTVTQHWQPRRGKKKKIKKRDLPPKLSELPAFLLQYYKLEQFVFFVLTWVVTLPTLNIFMWLILHFLGGPQTSCRFCCETPTFLKKNSSQNCTAFLIKMWTRCTGLFTYNSEPVICRDFSLLSPPAIISNPLSPANTFFHSITWYTSRVSLLGPSLIVRKPGNIGNLCSTGSKFNFQVTESLGKKEKLCMNSHVLCRVQTSHWPTTYVTYTEAYSQPYKTTFLVSQLKVYCVISTKWLINHIHTLYVIDIY